MDGELRILMVEDIPSDAELVQHALRKSGLRFSARRVETQDDFLHQLGAFDPHVIISDYSLPEFDGMTALRLAQEHAAETPFIMATVPINEDTAVECLKAGAADFVLKDRLSRIGPAVRSAIENERARAAGRDVEEALRAMHYEMEFAREIQQRQYPSTVPNIPGFDICGASYSAQAAGGDYYDYFELPHHRVVICTGDAIGHGLGAALLISCLRGYLRAFSHVDHRLRSVLERTNVLLADEIADQYFCTVIIALLDPKGRALHYVNAGHPPGLLLGADGEVKAQLDCGGFPLGMVREATYPRAKEGAASITRT